MAAERLFNMGWSLFSISSEREFVTNDIGIVKCLGRFDRPFRYGLGFVGGRSHWVFPLTPHRAFLFQPSLEGLRAEASDSWITAINAQLAADAQRFVYSRSYNAELASAARPPAT
jgi:hypothetical protein